MPKKVEKTSSTRSKSSRKITSQIKVDLKQNNDAFKIINIIAIVFVIAIFGFVAFVTNKNTSSEKSQKTQEVAAVSAISYDGQDGRNALELLKDKAEIKTQESSIGIFVTSINGVSNSEDHFWMFYVDGQLAPYSADQYTTKNGEKIQWRYDQFQ